MHNFLFSMCAILYGLRILVNTIFENCIQFYFFVFHFELQGISSAADLLFFRQDRKAFARSLYISGIKNASYC